VLILSRVANGERVSAREDTRPPSFSLNQHFMWGARLCRAANGERVSAREDTRPPGNVRYGSIQKQVVFRQTQ